MKKIIFLFSIIVATILTSCSSDSLPTTAEYTETTYPIKFNITAPLSIEGVSTRSTNIQRYFNSVEMRIYNEAGNQIMNFYYTDKIVSGTFSNNAAHIEISLPKGVYYIGFYTILDTKDVAFSTGASVDQQSSTHNYFSYYYPYEGTYNYYESIKTTVAPSNQTIEKNITLKPMWSNLNIALEDAQTFAIPEGTDALQFIVSPLYTGFQLNTKLATEKVEENWVSVYSKYKTNIVSIDSIRTNPTFTYPTYVYQTLPENGNLAIKVNYLKTKNTTDAIVLKTRELQIPDISIENGYNYNISGKLDAVNNGQSMNISLGEFNKEDVVIDF